VTSAALDAIAAFLSIFHYAVQSTTAHRQLFQVAEISICNWNWYSRWNNHYHEFAACLRRAY